MLQLMLAGLQVGIPVDQWQLAAPASPDLHAERRCPTVPSGDDIVVCGDRQPDRYRLRPLPQRFETKGGLPLAQTGIGGGTLGVTTQQAMIGNVPVNRVMLTLKLPF